LVVEGDFGEFAHLFMVGTDVKELGFFGGNSEANLVGPETNLIDCGLEVFSGNGFEGVEGDERDVVRID
jgi:hypothetical protein